jgi:hypothetical protein
VSASDRLRATGIVGPPGLVFMQRHCLMGEHGPVASGLSINGAGQLLCLVASVPLTDEKWDQVAEGQLIAIEKGEVVAGS